jgi:predicted Zn-dependent protease
MTDINHILDAARKAGAQQAEAYQVSNEETPVRFEANRLKELNSRHTSGVAVRVIANGRIGFASSTRPGDVRDVVQAAMETAPFGPEAHFDFPKQAANGARFAYKATMYSAFVYGNLIRGTDMLFVGDGDASCSPQLDTGAVQASIVRQLENARSHASCRTAEMPVLFTSIGVADALLGPIVMAFSGRLVHQGQSPHWRCARPRAHSTTRECRAVAYHSSIRGSSAASCTICRPRALPGLPPPAAPDVLSPRSHPYRRRRSYSRRVTRLSKRWSGE